MAWRGLTAVPFLADVSIKVGRVAYQGDTYLVGAASLLNAGNDSLIEALAAWGTRFEQRSARCGSRHGTRWRRTMSCPRMSVAFLLVTLGAAAA